ncbi:hypothetical protein Q8F55_009149 [Vanrija albida]|uniref:Myb-like domain-containing protein n=1 Tax=Vanrija albida TaxID=181172 RepID=A0ABR3PT17_9TREE
MPKVKSELSAPSRAHPYEPLGDVKPKADASSGLTERNLKAFQAQLLNASSVAAPSTACLESEGSVATPSPPPRKAKPVSKAAKAVKTVKEAKPKVKTEKGAAAKIKNEKGAAAKIKNEKGAPAPAAKGGYDRALLVSEVSKDTWRKTVFPALLAGRDWATDGAGWSRVMKIKLVCEVLATAKPDWEDVAEHFPSRTKTQVTDIWRKVVLPRLVKGQALA